LVESLKSKLLLKCKHETLSQVAVLKGTAYFNFLFISILLLLFSRLDFKLFFLQYLAFFYFSPAYNNNAPLYIEMTNDQFLPCSSHDED